jgi:hypothetical protein
MARYDLLHDTHDQQGLEFSELSLFRASKEEEVVDNPAKPFALVQQVAERLLA